MLIILLLGFGSFLCGLVAYSAALYYIWHETLGADASAVFFWGIIAYSILGVPAYLFSFRQAERFFTKRKRKTPLFIYPLLPVILSFVPFSLIVYFQGGGELRCFFTPEAFLFFILFATAGSAFGLGWLFSKGEKW
jgi:hypothetical protein